MEIEEENFDKPYSKDFTNYFPAITFVNDHKKLLNFGTLQNMMSTEGSPSNTPPNNYGLPIPSMPPPNNFGIFN
jgi:hypothetical protein